MYAYTAAGPERTMGTGLIAPVASMSRRRLASALCDVRLFVNEPVPVKTGALDV